MSVTYWARPGAKHRALEKIVAAAQRIWSSKAINHRVHSFQKSLCVLLPDKKLTLLSKKGYITENPGQ